MIQFVCDTCGKVKRPGDNWLLGLAAESVGTTAARREITILTAWSDADAVHPLAVHFSSPSCKDRYLAQLFGDQPPLVADVVEETVTVAAARPRVSRQTRGAAKKRLRRKAA